MTCNQPHGGSPETGITPDIAAQALVGAGDHTTIIQDAIDYARCMGFRSIVLPDTGLVWNAYGLVFDGVSLINRTTLRLKDGVDEGGPLATFTNGASLYGGVLDGNFQNNTIATPGNTRAIVAVQTNPRMEILDVLFTGGVENGLFIDLFSPGGRMRGGAFRSIAKTGAVVKSSGWSFDGVLFEGVGYRDGHNIRIGHWGSDASVYGPRGARGSWPALLDTRVTNCTFRYSQGVGVLCEWDTHGTIISGCYADRIANLCKAEDLPDDNVEDVIVTGNILRDLVFGGDWDPQTEQWSNAELPQTDLQMGARGVIFRDNILRDCAAAVAMSAEGVCSGNRFFNSGRAGRAILFNSYETIGTVTAKLPEKAGGQCNGNVLIEATGGIHVDASVDVDVFDNRISLAGTSATGVQLGDAGHRASRNQVRGGARGVRALVDTTGAAIVDNDLETSSALLYEPPASTLSNLVRDNPPTPDLSPTYVIANNAIAVADVRVARVDTEGSAATDQLDHISAARTGQVLTLRLVTSSRDVTVRDGVGNLQLAGGDFTLDHGYDTLTLYYNGSNWLELARSNNA